jgi:hypothetical protein
MARLTKGLTIVAAAAAVCLPVMAAGPHYSAWGGAQQVSPPVDLPTTDDGNFCLTKDGRGLFFSSNRAGGAGKYDLWVSRWNDDTNTWGDPTNLGPNVNSVMGDFTPALSRDEHWLFFASNRAGTLGGRDLYASYREYTHDDLAWGPAISLGPTVNSIFDDFGVTYFAGNGLVPPQLYFSSLRGGSNDFDIYVTEFNMDGSLTAPVAVPELATDQMEFLPAIRHDGLEIFFSSNRSGGLGGTDIWAATRETLVDPWSEPVNLGAGVNSTMDELYPAISSDRMTLFFFRAILGTQTPTSIWTSTRSKVNPE